MTHVHKWPGAEAETKIMQHLVAALGGHAVTVIRHEVGELLGFSVKGRTVVIRDMLEEAALSTDAKPVAIYKGNGLVDCGDSGHHNIELLKLIPANTPLYAEPVKTAPAVAVKALEAVRNELHVDTSNGKPGSISHDVGALHRIVAVVDAALSARGQGVEDQMKLKAPVFQRCHCGIMNDVCTCKSDAAPAAKQGEAE